MAKAQYFGIALTPPFWLTTALAYVGSREWLKPRHISAYFLVPIITIVVALTNDWHGLLWERFVPVTTNADADVAYGKWFAVHTAYSYAIGAVGSLILVARLSASPLYRAQLFVALVGPGIVMVMNLIYLINNAAMPFDPTPSAFALTFFGFAWGMARHQLFEFIPLARGRAVDGLRDALIVLDQEGRIVDTNPAARVLLNQGAKRTLGMPVSAVMPALDLGALKDQQSVELRAAEGKRLEARLSDVTSRDGTSQGTVLLLRDVTVERTAQEELLRAQEKLREVNQELERLALTDPLTGLANRRNLQKHLDEEIARARRYSRSLSFLMLDIDHFKSVNDIHGHATGDRVLEAIGRALLSLVRPGDVAARMGGEEFAVLLPETNLVDAREVAMRLRTALKNLSHHGSDQSPISITVSFGVATLLPADPGGAELTARADAALYHTKATGRDGITCAENGLHVRVS